MDIFICFLLCIIQPMVFGKKHYFELSAESAKRYDAEVKAGSQADMMENKHVYHAHKYKDLNRRRAAQLEKVYTEMQDEDVVGDFHENIQMAQNIAVEKDPRLIPMKASPELVLAVAKESAKIPVKYDNDDERVKILRGGDYWNGFWKEDVDPVTLLRTNDVEEEPKPEDLESVKAKIMPGSKLYHVVSVLQRISPKLLYIINKPI